MGLTFQQQFYYVPDEVYFVYDLSVDHGAFVCGIIEVPEDEHAALELEETLNLNDYLWQKIDFHNLIKNGYGIFDKIGIKDVRERFGID